MKKFIDKHFFIFILLCFAVIIVIYLISGIRMCTVESGSMEPTIPTWSLAIVNTNVTYDDIEVGDVVVYIRASDQRRIIHRVIEINEEGMVTQGDANSIDDGLSITRARDNLFAREMFHIPYLGWLSMAAHTPIGIGVIVAIAIWLFASDFIGAKKKEDDGETETEETKETEE